MSDTHMVLRWLSSPPTIMYEQVPPIFSYWFLPEIPEVSHKGGGEETE